MKCVTEAEVQVNTTGQGSGLSFRPEQVHTNRIQERAGHLAEIFGVVGLYRQGLNKTPDIEERLSCMMLHFCVQASLETMCDMSKIDVEEPGYFSSLLTAIDEGPHPLSEEDVQKVWLVNWLRNQAVHKSNKRMCMVHCEARLRRWNCLIDAGPILCRYDQAIPPPESPVGLVHDVATSIYFDGSGHASGRLMLPRHFGARFFHFSKA